VNALTVRGVTKTYPGHPAVQALCGVDLDVDAGERVAILGRSGAGKSTLLNILGLLDRPTAGSYRLLGDEVGSLGERGRDELRTRAIGFVFQEAHVLGHRTVRENLAIKLAINRIPRRDRAHRVRASLERVGLDHRIDAQGRLLSGGEKQRLAIARAISTGPSVLLADEPTGNLDPANSAAVLQLFDGQAAEGVAVVVITHDMHVAAWADRAVTLEAGRLECRTLKS
jgi:putative ABC transport system ATP-binding protein